MCLLCGDTRPFARSRQRRATPPPLRSFLNKHILSSLGGSAQTLGMVQMTTTFVLGAVKVHGAQCLRGRARSTALRDAPPPAPTGPAGRLLAAFQGLPEGFVRDMASVGVLRFLTVMAGLLAMSLVPVSFVETIKSTAPLVRAARAPRRRRRDTHTGGTAACSSRSRSPR